MTTVFGIKKFLPMPNKKIWCKGAFGTRLVWFDGCDYRFLDCTHPVQNIFCSYHFIDEWWYVYEDDDIIENILINRYEAEKDGERILDQIKPQKFIYMKRFKILVFNVVQFRWKEVFFAGLMIGVCLAIFCASWIPIPLAYMGAMIWALINEHRQLK